MYDPEEDAKLLSDLKKLVKQKWNTYSEFESGPKDEIKGEKDIYISSSGLPISISHLDRNDKMKIQNNKSKSLVCKRRVEIKSKPTLKPSKNNINEIESDDEDKGRMSTILEMTKN